MTRTDDLLAPREAELRDLFKRSMNGTSVPSQLGPQSLREGRRLRTRRRAGIAAGGAIAVGVAAALIVPVALAGGSDTVVDPAGVPSGSATSSAPPTPDAAERPDGWWNMPATDMVSAVQAILPDGVVVTSSGPLVEDTVGRGAATGHIVSRLRAPTGTGQLTVVLSPFPLPGESSTPIAREDLIEPGTTLPGGNDLACPVNLPTRAQCVELLGADGALIGRRLSEATGDVIRLEVVLRRNGGTIYGASTNTFDDTGDPAARPLPEAPPLTLDQLEDLVRNDTWVMPAT